MGGRTDMRYFLILNPGSRSGESKKLFGQIRREMRRRGLDSRYAVTRCLADAGRLSRQASEEGYDVIVAVGGDGTISQVINGLYDQSGARISAAKLGVIYTGTSPDFCRSHQIPVRDVKRAVKVLAAGRTKTIGIGKIRFQDKPARYFACCANIGLGARLARAANSGIRGRVGDQAGTFLALMGVLASYRPTGLTVNGCRLPHVYNLSVGKTRYLASGLKISHLLPSGASAFYALPIRRRPIWHIARLYTGAALPLTYCRRMEIRGRAEVEADGDPIGRLPVVITPAPAIEVLYERT